MNKFDEKTGGPASPIRIDVGDGSYTQYYGLTVRDHFAIEALNGVIACFRDHNNCASTETRVRKAYEYADAMIAERNRT